MTSMAVPFFLTARVNMETDNEQIGYPPWSQLPGLVVENIYSFLSRKDQKSMSLVCRNWRKEFTSPSLWRKVTFCVPDRDYLTAQMWPDVTYAWRYGAMFHHVKILLNEEDYFEYDRSYTETVWSHLISFLRALTRHSNLISISFKNMHYAEYSTFQASAEIYAEILNFIKSQKKLEFVEFSKCILDFREGEEILGAILLNTSETLRYLQLQDFADKGYRYEFTNIIVSEDLNFRLFMKLKKLKIHYCSLFENMMMSFYEYRRKVDMRGRTGCLEEIKIKFDDLEYPGIHAKVWKYFSEIFPGLRVHLRFHFGFKYRFSSSFIVPHLPLRKVHFSFYRIDDLNIAFGTITSSRINKCLEAMKIDILDRPFNISTNLISLTSVCPMLKTIKMYCQYPVEGLDNVLNSWLVEKPASLDSVEIIINCFSEEELEATYTWLNDIYAPLLETSGIKLNIHCW